MIGIEDILLDRLRAAVHWKSIVDQEWGYRLLFMYHPELDIPYIKSCLETPAEEDEFHDWLERLGRGENQTDQ